jgi:hypothetical protein
MITKTFKKTSITTSLESAMEEVSKAMDSVSKAMSGLFTSDHTETLELDNIKVTVTSGKVDISSKGKIKIVLNGKTIARPK